MASLFSFDRLVIGVGAITNTFNVPGTESVLFMKEASDAVNLRTRILRSIQRVSENDTAIENELTFIIVGGGPTGTELAAEILDLMDQNVSKLPNANRLDSKVSIFH